MTVISQRDLGALDTGGIVGLAVFEVVVFAAIVCIIWTIYRLVRGHPSDPLAPAPHNGDTEHLLQFNAKLYWLATSGSDSSDAASSRPSTFVSKKTESSTCRRVPSAVLMLEESAIPFMREVNPMATLPRISIPSAHPISTDAYTSTRPVAVMVTPISAASSLSAYSQSTMGYSQWHQPPSTSAPSSASETPLPVFHHQDPSHSSSQLVSDTMDAFGSSQPASLQSMASHLTLRQLPTTLPSTSYESTAPSAQQAEGHAPIRRQSIHVDIDYASSLHDATSPSTVLSPASVYSQCTAVASPSSPPSKFESIPNFSSPRQQRRPPLPLIPDHVLRRVEQHQEEPALSRAPTKVIAGLVKVRAKRATRVGGREALERKVSRIERNGSIRTMISTTDISEEEEEEEAIPVPNLVCVVENDASVVARDAD